jgi:hypothetical protein
MPREEFQEDSRMFKTLPQLRVEEVKNLPLDGYQVMLNTKPLGGEEVPFYVIVFYSIVKKSNWEWKIREHNRGG